MRSESTGSRTSQLRSWMCSIRSTKSSSAPRTAWARTCSPNFGDLTMLSHAEPVYETFAGWRTSTADARALEDLPAAARAYLDRIEQLVEAPITYVSVGTRRDQIIGL